MTSRRRFLAASALALAGCGRRPSAGEVNVYCWSDYLASDTIAGFERETGVRVNYETFESQEEMLAKILAGGARWDVVFPSASFVGPLIRQGLVTPLDHARLPNLPNLEPRFQDPPWDRGDRYTVPYMWGVSGYVYNARAAGGVLTSWADLWNPRWKGKLTMLDDPAEVLGVCLKKLGHSVNSVEPGELEAARAEALRQKPLVRAYINAEVKPQLIAGDVWIAQLWNGDAYQAIGENPDLRYCFPTEGLPVYADCAAVLAGARNLNNAYRWIDYLLRPEVSAAIARATLYPTPNARAAERLEAALRNNPDIYPPPERLARAEWFTDVPPAGQLLRDRFWTEIKAA